jgi:hypothetical protein
MAFFAPARGGTPPPSVYWNQGLRKNPARSLSLNELRVKSSRNNNLRLSKNTQWFSGSFEGRTSCRTGLETAPIKVLHSIVALGGLLVNLFRWGDDVPQRCVLLRSAEFRSNLNFSHDAAIQLLQIGCGNPVFAMLRAADGMDLVVS